MAALYRRVPAPALIGSPPMIDDDDEDDEEDEEEGMGGMAAVGSDADRDDDVD